MIQFVHIDISLNIIQSHSHFAHLQNEMFFTKIQINLSSSKNNIVYILLGNVMYELFPSTGENGMKWCEIRVTRERTGRIVPW